MDYLVGTLSPQKNWYYAVDQDNQLLCFNIYKKSNNDNSIEYTPSYEYAMKLHEKDTCAISHHPNKNIIATASKDGYVKIWSDV